MRTSAYDNKHRRKRLRTHGIKDRIRHRSHKHQEQLPRWQTTRNGLIAPIGKKVERVFGALKRSYGFTKVRYYSMRCKTTQLMLMVTALNLRRAVVLTS